MRGILRIPIRLINILGKLLMVKSFHVKPLFSEQELTELSINFGFRRFSTQELDEAITDAFRDYIVVSLSELGEGVEENKRLYVEANHYIQQASKLLLGMPHPAGKMASRLDSMSSTLIKIMEGSHDISAQRAARFMEKNLGRRLRDIWALNTSTVFHAGTDGMGKSPRDFLLKCFKAAGEAYPELEWFKQVDEKIADLLIKSIKR